MLIIWIQNEWVAAVGTRPLQKSMNITPRSYGPNFSWRTTRCWSLRGRCPAKDHLPHDRLWSSGLREFGLWSLAGITGLARWSTCNSVVLLLYSYNAEPCICWCMHLVQGISVTLSYQKVRHSSALFFPLGISLSILDTGHPAGHLDIWTSTQVWAGHPDIQSVSSHSVWSDHNK